MLDKVTIVDFEDSFTFNIAEVIYPSEKNCSVIHHEEFFLKLSDSLQNINSNHAVILGPGPGHPGEYLKYADKISKLMKHPQIFLMGICLGHQIIGLIKGYTVEEVAQQHHGVNSEFNFRGKIIMVQRYNSLGVFNGKQEIPILNFERGVSYQFHPESVGTSDPATFFEGLLAFINY